MTPTTTRSKLGAAEKVRPLVFNIAVSSDCPFFAANAFRKVAKLICSRDVLGTDLARDLADGTAYRGFLDAMQPAPSSDELESLVATYLIRDYKGRGVSNYAAFNVSREFLSKDVRPTE